MNKKVFLLSATVIMGGGYLAYKLIRELALTAAYLAIMGCPFPTPIAKKDEQEKITTS